VDPSRGVTAGSEGSQGRRNLALLRYFPPWVRGHFPLIFTERTATISSDVCWTDNGEPMGLEFVKVPATMLERLRSWMADRLGEYQASWQRVSGENDAVASGHRRPYDLSRNGSLQMAEGGTPPKQELLLLKQRSQRIVINTAFRREPMNKFSRADVHRLLNLLLLNARLQVCLFARVGNHLPCLRLHCRLCLAWLEKTSYAAAGVRTAFI